MEQYKNILSFAFAMLFVFCGVLSFSQDSYAGGISVAPTVIEQRLFPGDTIDGIYRVKNQSELTVSVVVTAENWMARLFNADEDLTVSDWVTVSPSEFELKPGEAKDITYTLIAPFRFTGEKVAQVFFEFKSAMSPSMMGTRLGVIVYMMARDAEKVNAKVENITMSYKPSREKDGVMTQAYYNISFDVANLGNVHLRPVGAVMIRDTKTKKIIDAVDIEPSKGVYPDKNENFFYSKEASVLSPGEYKAEIKIDIGQLYSMDKEFKKKIKFKVEE